MRQIIAFIVITSCLLVISGDPMLYNQRHFDIGYDVILHQFYPFQIGPSSFDFRRSIWRIFQTEVSTFPQCPPNLPFPGKVIKGDCYYINPTPGSFMQYTSFCPVNNSGVFSPFPSESQSLFTDITEAFPAVFNSLPTKAKFWLGLLQSQPEAPFSFVQDSSVSVDPTIGIFNHSDADVFNGVVLVPPGIHWKVIPLLLPGPHLDNYFICKVKTTEGRVVSLKMK